MKLDFVAIGDITTDDFIKLADVRIDTEQDEGDQGQDEICFRFGDKIEYEDHKVVPAVGNSPNAAVSAHRLGLKSGLVTNMGDDEVGQGNMRQLEKEGVNTGYVRVHEGRQSNYHFVLRYKAERTILVKHYEYPYSLPDFEEAPSWLYLSSLGETSLPFHEKIVEYIRDNDTKLAFQPGTFQMQLGYEKLREVYEQSEVFFANKEEYQRILGSGEESIGKLIREMHERGPNIAVLTDGTGGAYAFDGDSLWHVPMYPDPAPPVDRTGAGDSFSSTFTATLALGNDIPTALRRAPINSMSVVQHIGAQEGLVTKEELDKYLSEAPDDFQVEKIN